MYRLITIIILLCSFNALAKPTAVFFDCDGVLVDTPHMKYAAWNRALNDFNIKISVDEYQEFIGYSLQHIANAIAVKYNPKLDQEKLIALRDEYYKIEQKKGVPVLQPGVDYLNALLERKDEFGIKIAVVSADRREAIIRNLQFAGVKHELLDGVFSGRDDLTHIKDPEGTNKPKPYIYQLAATKLNVNPTTTVVFEDSNAGVVSANSAGMTVIAVPNPLTKNHDFSAAKVVTNFNKLNVADINNF